MFNGDANILITYPSQTSAVRTSTGILTSLDATNQVVLSTFLVQRKTIVVNTVKEYLLRLSLYRRKRYTGPSAHGLASIVCS